MKVQNHESKNTPLDKFSTNCAQFSTQIEESDVSDSLLLMKYKVADFTLKGKCALSYLVKRLIHKNKSFLA